MMARISKALANKLGISDKGFDVVKLKTRKQLAVVAKMVEPSLEIAMTLPITVKSDQNLSSAHWATKMRFKNRQQKETLGFLWAVSMDGINTLPGGIWKVTLCRLGGRTDMDSDNLARCFKHVRDCVSVWLKRKDDRDSDKMIWAYGQDQLQGPAGVRITIQRLPAKENQDVEKRPSAGQ